MKCLGCGYCCFKYLVVIVNDPSLGVVPGNLVAHHGNGPCKHLRYSDSSSFEPGGGGYYCAIHDEPWYKETPCHAFGQVEASPDTPCRIGVGVLSGKISFHCGSEMIKWLKPDVRKKII